MKIGFVGSYGTAQQVLTMAEEVEAHGWDGFFTWDGISIGPVDTWDPWTLLGAVAVRTERVRLGALIFPLARRRPWKVARESITVDHLSGGRLVMPVGLGVQDDGGFSKVGGEAQTHRARAELLDESLAVLERAWTGEPFSYRGAHHTVTDLVIAPPPVQRPRIPVWPIAGWRSERSMGRAARWDGAVLQRIGGDQALEPREVAQAVTWLHERRAELVATEPERIGRTFDVVVQGASPDDPAAAADHLAALADAGATWWIEARWDAAQDTPEALLDRIRRGPPTV
jgi:alkanesulfonate monooxygenase SsuD/methylene tetrahydromethanopterin reductase-like flavin-dependent oxidoreductase (luciferase family)